MGTSSCSETCDALSLHLTNHRGACGEGDVPYTILHPDMPTSLEDLQKGWIQMKEDRDTFEAQLYSSEKRVLELTKQLQEEQSVKAYLAPKRMHSVFLSENYFVSPRGMM